ncbi:MAG: DUF2279 domain-containing protein [Aureispira sp.]|nr:DUF2279 domain-containing protein [Aureispira sp.]
MRVLLCCLVLCWSQLSFATQWDSLPPAKLKFFDIPEKLHPVRFWTLTGTLVAGYSAITVGLDRAWYANYPRGKFHFFNDWKGWRQMDKMGHAMTGYFESKLIGDMYYWTGIPRKHARWVGFGGGLLFQTTLEFLDAFSEQWGFSWGDMAFNTIGSGLYLGQELLWNEQRIRMKISAHRPQYSNQRFYATNSKESTTIQQRADNLFGTSVPELFFKEYNGETIWLSINIPSFLKKRPKWLPAWLNLALGYGIENVLGAEKNEWTNSNGSTFVAPDIYPRHSQFYLSLDIDFERIPTRHRWLKFIFGIANIFKVPFPALEVNTLGQVHFHPFYF